MKHKIRADQSKDFPFLFISYSHEDDYQMQDILRELDRNHFCFWYDEGILSGREWEEEIGWRVENCTQFVCILSPRAIVSDYVKNEIHLAIERKKKLCLIYLEPMTSLGSELNLKLLRKQFIHAYENDFYEKLINNIDLSTIKRQESNVVCAKYDLEEKYKILNTIVDDGFGVVYKGRHNTLGTTVTIKHIVYDDSFQGKIIGNLLRTERKALVQLCECPYVPRILDYYEDKENIYLVESFVAGITLKRYQAKIDELLLKNIAKKMLMILLYLENSDMTHNDIKPLNIMIDEFGNLTLLDFGCSTNIQSNMLTLLPNMGTPGYAAPELYDRQQNNNRSVAADIYSLGRTLIFLLIRDFIDTNNYYEIPSDYIRIYRKDICPELEAILLKMTREDREDRYQNAKEVLNDLEEL